MKHTGTLKMETERLILRRFVSEDIPLAFKNWLTDETVTRFLSWLPHKDISVSEKILGGWIDSYKNDDFYQWAIVLKETDEPIGTISVLHTNERIDCFEIGYCIGSKWWHKNIMTEAFGAVISFFFDVVGANRIEAHHDPNNPASGRVMQKCGLAYEGTLRQGTRSNQGITDTCVYAILAEDYYK